MKNFNRILIIKLGALGDFVLTTGLMRSIRQKYPEAHVTLMTNEKFVELAKQSGYFNDFIIDNRTRKIKDYIRIARQLSASQFDLILDLQLANRTKRLYYFFARFFSKKSFCWGILNSKGVVLKCISKKIFCTWGKQTIETLKMAFFPPSLKFCHGKNTHFSILPKKYILLIPGCSPNHPYKRWPVDSYRALALKLATHKIYTVVLGTKVEETEIKQICQDNPYALNFCDKSSLMDIPDLAKRASAIVGNDTGPTHICSLVEKPVIALFCKKTETSALHLKNVHNLIAEQISDIQVEAVLKILKKII